jgi:ABC-type multidrug transport system ATPase subunit
VTNPDEELAALADVSKRYGDRIALENVSFAVRAGEVLGIAGLNGAGKSTALRVLLGLAFPDSGRARFAPGLRERFGGIGYLPEETNLPPRLTGREVVEDAARMAARRGNSGRRACESTLERCGIASAAGYRCETYSKGMARRVGLAVALVTAPSLLVLDEPQSGLDPLGRDDLDRILRAHRTGGGGAIVATHDLHEAASLCDRVIVLRDGCIGAELTGMMISAVAIRAALDPAISPRGERSGS